MASSGPRNPSTAANDSGVGAVAWNDPSNAATSDNNRATATLSPGQSTQYLKATNFGFSLPSGATVDGIVVEVERSTNTASTVNPRDWNVRLFKSGVVGGDNKAAAADLPSSDAYATYGASNDLWGMTWTHSDINDSGFGVGFACTNPSGLVTHGVRVDHVRVTVYYTEGGSGGQAARSMHQYRMRGS